MSGLGARFEPPSGTPIQAEQDLAARLVRRISEKARNIFEFAANQPLTHDGKTLVQALAELSR